MVSTTWPLVITEICQPKSQGELPSYRVIQASPIEISVPLTKFTIFGKLPSELRLKVWGLALNTERILEVIWDGAEKDPKEASHYHYRISPRSGARPILMDICRESRAEAERFYTAVDFTTTLQNAHADFDKCGSIMTYYDPE